MTAETFDRVHLDGTGIDRITEDEVVSIVREAIAAGHGGRIATPNIDILRQAGGDERVRAYLDDADLIVADGMPLVWASRLSGSPLPERVAGSSLIWSLSEGLGRDGRSVFVIGGAPASEPHGGGSTGGGSKGGGSTGGGLTGGGLTGGGLTGGGLTGGGLTGGGLTGGGLTSDGATRAAGRLAARFPGLRIAGALSPPFGFEHDATTYAAFRANVIDARPDLVFVGLGFPKQEAVVTRLRADLPRAWFIGCGVAVNFVAGDIDRAPRWMQRTGLEWAHRLGTEPRRLGRRYLRHDAGYALRLLAGSAARR